MIKYLFIICLFMESCTSPLKLRTANETLISTQYKVIEHGFFSFFVFTDNSKVKEIVYAYSINMNKKKVSCSKIQTQMLSLKDDLKKIQAMYPETSVRFQQIQENTWREKYYLCFSDDFLKMTNDEKMTLLDSICNISNYE